MFELPSLEERELRDFSRGFLVVVAAAEVDEETLTKVMAEASMGLVNATASSSERLDVSGTILGTYIKPNTHTDAKNACTARALKESIAILYAKDSMKM